MKYLFHHASELREFLTCKPILLFDFDGTLTGIVPSSAKDEVRLSSETQRLLLRLTHSYPVGILSGRERGFVKKCVAAPVDFIIGNHGSEWVPPLATEKNAQTLVSRWWKEISATSWPEDCAWENKRLSLTVHYASSSSGDAALKIIKQLGLQKLNILSGKKTLNLLSTELLDKGGAALRAMELSKRDRILFVGDDETDERVFRLGKKIFSIRVGKSIHSSANWFLKSQTEVDALIERIIYFTQTTLQEKSSVAEPSPRTEEFQ